MECNDEVVFSSIEEALEDIRNGKMVMVVDDEDRENEGDLIIAGQFADGPALNFMATHGKGLICTPVSQAVAERLNLTPMVPVNTDNHCTAFTVSVDHVDTTTGISAYERSTTAMKLADPASKASDFRRPGHMFPLIAVKNGVLERNGHTEATVDLCRLAGLEEVGLCCEIMKDDGHMARLPELIEMAREWNLKLITIADLIQYRKYHEKIMECAASARLPTRYGDFTIYAFVNKVTGNHHVALVMGDIADGEPVLCRVHSECLTGDAFGSLKCDCGQQYDAAMKKIAEEGRGVLVYMRQEGRGIGFVNKMKAYHLQDLGADTVDANLKLGLPEDAREYYEGVQILESLGVHDLRLMTNNPKKLEELVDPSCDLRIVEHVPLEIEPQEFDRFYLKTKRERMGHLLSMF
ncbi:MAG: bifunctional 3,4-dihydroxy-2-butanone-4-phosphate synthase/GTP cyclohydrolase II [Treponema sp.]|nr:bifunctional 3,4-dihydroxy-2-butanone-4-phosphate synthase/GTP cyclohydrolase II [Treponema sp.]